MDYSKLHIFLNLDDGDCLLVFLDKAALRNVETNEDPNRKDLLVFSTKKPHGRLAQLTVDFLDGTPIAFSGAE